jgi:hypothetical protein
MSDSAECIRVGDYVVFYHELVVHGEHRYEVHPTKQLKEYALI